MSSLQVGPRGSVERGPTGVIYGVILAVVVILAVAVFVAAAGGLRYSPPNETGAPATYAPGVLPTSVPSVPRYP
jgi:hypothetical protein